MLSMEFEYSSIVVYNFIVLFVYENFVIVKPLTLDFYHIKYHFGKQFPHCLAQINNQEVCIIFLSLIVVFADFLNTVGMQFVFFFIPRYFQDVVAAKSDLTQFTSAFLSIILSL